MATLDQTNLEAITLHGKQAASGAALYATLGAITFTDVTVSNNSASNNCGGIYLTGANNSLFLQNSTIVDNHRANTGGTGFSGLIIGSNATVSIDNTVLANNDDKNCGGTSGNWSSLGHNLSSDSSCAFVQAGDQQAVDPMLGPLVDNGGRTPTHALRPDSPAIDTGSVTACPASDQRGVARPFDGDGDGVGVCDKGAYEARNQITMNDVTIDVETVVRPAPYSL